MIIGDMADEEESVFFLKKNVPCSLPVATICDVK